ncbi:Putative ribonuclease H protein family [Arachis hypogaea]|nr:Putative ribonuclease H protein family [Arachis hypogaea]
MPQKSKVQKVFVWVRIPNLPAKLYNRYFIWKVEKIIETMLKVYEHTFIHLRGKFAHICMEIDLRKKLVPSFSILKKVFKFEYEGLHQICFQCGRYSYKCDGCPKKTKKVKVKDQN